MKKTVESTMNAPAWRQRSRGSLLCRSLLCKSLLCKTLLCGWLLCLLVACEPSDPRENALNQAVLLMQTIVKSHVLVDAVRNADPQMRATTAAGSALTGGITANFPLPPREIGILEENEPLEAWSVVIRGDDVKKQVIIEGYGEDLNKPLVTESIDFPP